MFLQEIDMNFPREWHFIFKNRPVCRKLKTGCLLLGKLAENPACHSGSFLEADDKTTSFGSIRCSFHGIESIETPEALHRLQGALDSDVACSFQGLDGSFKFSL